MWFVVIGTILLILKVADLTTVATWSWWWILSPFGCAVLWWAWSDHVGLTQKRETRKMEQKRADRRAKAMVALGIKPEAARRQSRMETARKRLGERIEGKRTEVREHNKAEVRDSVLHSRLSSQFDQDSKDEPAKPAKK
jgi:small Trp-rich protein